MWTAQFIQGSNPMHGKKRYVKPALRRRERLADVTEGEVPRVTDGVVNGRT